MFAHYRFIDFATQGYLAVTGLFSLWGAVSGNLIWGWVALGHGLVILGIHRLIVAHGNGEDRKPWRRFIRHLYPVLLYTAVYNETGHLSQLFATGYYDPLLIRIEESWFGGQPSLDWMVEWPSLLVSEILHAAYFSFYVMIGGMAVALYLQDIRRFDHFISVTSFVFYVCYLVYVFLPTAGPCLFFHEVNGYQLPSEVVPAGVTPAPEVIASGFFFRIMEVIYRYFETPGAAFPSSHVAVAWCTVWFSFRYLPRLRWAHAITAGLLSLATVYCRYHYAIDVVGGLLTAVVLVPLGDRLHRRFTGESLQIGRR